MNVALSISKKPMLGTMAGIAIVVLTMPWPEQAYATLRFVLVSFLDVMPTVGIGIVLSAWVAASGAFSAKWFAGRPASAIVIASASIWGVMAVAAALRSSTIVLFALAAIGSPAIGYCFDAIWTLLL